MSREWTRRRNARGFTLLELLVAMTVLVLLSSVAFAAVRMGQRTWESSLEYSDAIEAFRTTTNFLRRQLGQLPRAEIQGDKAVWSPLAGDSEILEFVGPAPRGSSTGGLLRYRLWLDQQALAGPGELRLAVTPFDPGEPSAIERGVPAATSTLIAGVTDLSFEYFGRPDDDQPAIWRRSWSSELPGKPELVRLRLKLATAAVEWPDLVVAVGGGEARR